MNTQALILEMEDSRKGRKCKQTKKNANEGTEIKSGNSEAMKRTTWQKLREIITAINCKVNYVNLANKVLIAKEHDLLMQHRSSYL